jgi:hypothetical protein
LNYPRYGYIEGYYGKLLDWQQRASIIQTLQECGANTYLYAPKEDPWHRRAWRTPYPRKWIEQFSRVVDGAKRRGIAVVPALAPGLSFSYVSKSDYRKLLQKFIRFIDAGCSTVALLMDDIPHDVPESSKKAYHTLAAAHGELLEKLLYDCKKGHRSIQLWFCPTVYTDQFAHGDGSNSPYIRELAESIPRDVSIFWTGESVVSQHIDKKNLSGIAQRFHNRLLIWDNFYANDYAPQRLFLGPYTGRSQAIKPLINGILLNATGHAETDRLLLRFHSSFLHGKRPRSVWKETVASLAHGKQIGRILPLFPAPFTTPPARIFTQHRIETLRKALHTLLWEWKSPLQREWYPFLYMAQTDLALLSAIRDKSVRAEWIQKKYSPIITSLLLS